jgi:hypothetical protein
MTATNIIILTISIVLLILFLMWNKTIERFQSETEQEQSATEQVQSETGSNNKSETEALSEAYCVTNNKCGIKTITQDNGCIMTSGPLGGMRVKYNKEFVDYLCSLPNPSKTYCGMMNNKFINCWNGNNVYTYNIETNEIKEQSKTEQVQPATEQEQPETEPEQPETEQEHTETEQVQTATDIKKQVSSTKKALKQLESESTVVKQELQEISNNFDYNAKLSEEEHNKVVSLAETVSEQESESEQMNAKYLQEEKLVSEEKQEAETEMIDVQQSETLSILEDKVSANYNIINKLNKKMLKIDQMSRNVQSLISNNKILLEDIRSKLLAVSNARSDAEAGAGFGLHANGYAKIANDQYYKNLKTAQSIRNQQKGINNCPISSQVTGNKSSRLNPVNVLEVNNQEVGSTVPVVGW